MSVAALRRSPLLDGLSDEALQRLEARGEEIRLEPAELLLAQGSEPDAMYVLLEGALDVHKAVDGEDVLIGTVEEGELVGELGLLHGRPRTAGVRAARPSRLLRIPGSALDELLGNPRAARQLLATATRRLEQQELLMLQHGRMAALGTLTAGLLHELNNPAAAVGRAVANLAPRTEALRLAERELVAHGATALLAELEGLVPERPGRPPDPLARADAEEQWRAWLSDRGVGEPWTVSGPLADAAVEPAELEKATHSAGAETVAAAARWIAARLGFERLLHEAGTGAHRIADIVGAVKSYSHHGEAPVQDVDVHEGIDAALTLLAHKIPDGVEVHRDYGDAVGRVRGYPGDLNVVWTNLLDNALDAMGTSGSLTLSTRREGSAVVVRVTDDGPGIPEEVQHRMWDPFFTTKGVGQGTGLGLATTQAIVRRRHQGSISVESRPGRTTFTVELPGA